MIDPNSNFVKVAAVQSSPVFFDIHSCLDKAEGLIKDAKLKGCTLIAFGEAWFPGYPFHIWLGPPAWWLQYTDVYQANSLSLDSAEFERLCSLARESEIMICAGISERANSSLYLSQVLIDQSGELLNLRRKLKPTHVERSVFGEGYGIDLAVVDTDIGRVGQLCCWEHLQPLSKYALYSQNEQIHISAWPSFVLYKEQAHALGAEVNMAASQVYAVEGQCFVIAASSTIDQSALDFFKVGSEAPRLIELGGGSSMIFAPDGKRLADYLPEKEEGLILAELDKTQITLAKAIADPAGHYSKPESTRLLINRNPQNPVVEETEETFFNQAESHHEDSGE